MMDRLVPKTGNGAGTRPVDAVRDVDVVVVGSGIAGLSVALGLASDAHARRVVVISKTDALAGGSSALAQGGIAVALDPDDSPAEHAADTLAVSGGIGDKGVVGILTREGPARVRRLIELGANFDRDSAGELHFGREAAHGRSRILHADGDATGAELIRALVEAVLSHPRIEIRTKTFARDIVREGGRVMGVVARADDGRSEWWRAPEVVLATGGIGQLYSRTTNPAEVTGDGLAMAARAGARLIDLEFVQFHPTALAAEGADPMPLLTEALRGEGAVLVDSADRRFMPAIHPDAELAPRDIVARAIHAKQQSGEGAFLDARAAVGEHFPTRFPTVFALAMAHGVDPRLEPMPVSPAAHYHMGGIMVDADGRTNVPGLWACGEAASTGAHGANRLASNSLLEGLVFGARLAEAIIRGGRGRTAKVEALESIWLGGYGGSRGSLDSRQPRGSREAGWSGSSRWSIRSRGSNGCRESHQPDLPGASGATHFASVNPSSDEVAALRLVLRETTWEGVGLERDARSLRASRELFADILARLPDDGSRELLELRNLALVGQLVAAAAEIRTESRGAHSRRDYPEMRPEWHRRLVLELREDRLHAGVFPVIPPPDGALAPSESLLPTESYAPSETRIAESSDVRSTSYR